MTRVAAATVLAAAAVAALASADSYFTGDGTAYTLGSVSSGNCNFMYDPGVGGNYAALNNAQWSGTMNCGRCAEVSCADARCSDTTKAVTVYLVDRCPECSEGDLDLSPTVFKTLTGSDPARYSIKWRFVDCPVSGNLQYCAKSGSSNYWLAIQPANMASGIASMTIGGQTPSMVDSAFYFLVKGGVDISSVQVATTSVSGETITETVSLTADSCTQGSRQFSGGSASSGTTTTTTTSAPAVTTSAPEATTSAPVATTSAPVSTTSAPVTTTAAPEITTAAPTATPQASDTSTPTATSTPVTQTTESSGSASVTDSPWSYSQTIGSDVASDFDTLNDGSNSSVLGTVTAADESSSGVSILDSSETGVANTTPTSAPSAESDSSVQGANTQSEDSSAGTSPVLIALAVAAAVGAVALAAVYVRVQKKKIDDKINDRDDAAMQRSFDTFSSPVRVQSAIAQL